MSSESQYVRPIDHDSASGWYFNKTFGVHELYGPEVEEIVLLLRRLSIGHDYEKDNCDTSNVRRPTVNSSHTIPAEVSKGSEDNLVKKQITGPCIVPDVSKQSHADTKHNVGCRSSTANDRCQIPKKRNLQEFCDGDIDGERVRPKRKRTSSLDRHVMGRVTGVIKSLKRHSDDTCVDEREKSSKKRRCSVAIIRKNE